VRQTFHLPPCGQFDSFLAGPRVNLATASVPTGDCHAAASTRVDLTQGHIFEHPHAALGLICRGTVDAALGPPTDCVTPGMT